MKSNQPEIIILIIFKGAIKEIREYSQKKREEPAKLDLEEAKEEANKTLSSEISPKKTTFMKGYTNIFLIFLLLLCVYVHVCV